MKKTMAMTKQIVKMTSLVVGGCLLLSACQGMGAGRAQPYGNAPYGQSDQQRSPYNEFGRRGVYQQPIHLQPEPTPSIPQEDLCRSRLYLGLVGQHEGSVVFSALPGRTRVVKPASDGVNRDDFLSDMEPETPFVEVREYLSGQTLYTPSIRAVRLSDQLGPIEPDRLTVELDADGYIRALNCR